MQEQRTHEYTHKGIRVRQCKIERGAGRHLWRCATCRRSGCRSPHCAQIRQSKQLSEWVEGNQESGAKNTKRESAETD